MGWATDMTRPATTCRFGKFTLERSKRRLLRDGVPVELEDRVLDLILVLLDNRERAMDRREIVDALWGKRPVGDTTLRQLLYKARRVLGDDGAQQTIIRTLHGRGVQWVAPVAPPPDFWAASTVPGGTAPEAERTLTSGLGATLSVVWQTQKITLGERAPTPICAATAPTTGVKPPVPARYHTTWGMTVALLVLASLTTFGVLWLRPVAFAPTSARSPGSLTALGTTEPVVLVVLPFANLGPEPDTRDLGDGLSDELINRLGAYPGMHVAARTSTLVFREQPLDLRAAAGKLGATSILEGSVQRAGDCWRVRIALIDARDGYVVWSAKYAPPHDNLMTLEDAITDDVVNQLLPRLHPRVAMAPPTRTRASQAAGMFESGSALMVSTAVAATGTARAASPAIPAGSATGQASCTGPN